MWNSFLAYGEAVYKVRTRDKNRVLNKLHGKMNTSRRGAIRMNCKSLSACCCVVIRLKRLLQKKQS